MKKFITALMCMLGFLLVNCKTTNAASAFNLASYYELKAGSNSYDKNLGFTVTGGKEKKVKLDVKETGTFKIQLWGWTTNVFYDLSDNEQYIVKFTDAKGKTLKSKTLKDSTQTSIDIKLKKGTYYLVFSTKNVKKDAKRYPNLIFTFNTTTKLKTDKTKLAVFTKANGWDSATAKMELVNDKDQFIKINTNRVYASHLTPKMTVKDSKGQTMYSTTEDTKRVWTWHYLPKGTYQVEFAVDYGYTTDTFWVETLDRKSAPIVKTADTKQKAVTYTGTSKYFAYSSNSVKKKSQWMKFDTSKNDYAFEVNEVTARGTDGVSELSGVNVYKEDGTKVELNPKEGYLFYKGTGSYYVEIPTSSTQVAVVKALPVEAIIVANGNRYLVSENDEFNVKSSASKVATGKVEVKQESYVKMTIENDGKESTAALYDSKNQKIKADGAGISKVKAGTYTFKQTVANAEVEYDGELTIYAVKDMKSEKNVYTAGKKATVTLSNLTSNRLYQFIVTAPHKSGVKRTIAIYENGKKIAESTSDVYFNTKAKKTYKAVITTSENQLLKYSWSNREAFSEANKDLSSTKKKAKTVTMITDGKFTKAVTIQGKTSGWMKVNYTGKNRGYIDFDGYVNKGQVMIKVYNSKGTLKKTIKLNTTTQDGKYSLASKDSCYIKVECTDKNASIRLKINGESNY